MRRSGFVFLIAVVLWGAGCQHATLDESRSAGDAQAIEHVVVIYLENHSFFNLMNGFPGADQTLPSGYQGQRGPDGQLYAKLPPVTERLKTEPDKRFPVDLSNETFSINKYVKISEKVPDPVHDFFQHQKQINDGKQDRFAELSGVGGLAMGYFDMRDSQLWKYAKEFTLADHFFQSAFGGSFLNHVWLVAAMTPKFENPPEKMKAVLNPDGSVKKFGSLTSDGYAVNTVEARNPPYKPSVTEAGQRLQSLEEPTIGDRLSEKKIAWAWYSGGWNDRLAGKDPREFQHHHQPFVYFKKYGPGTEGRARHLKDEQDLFNDIKTGRLPAVSFFKPVGVENAHPQYSEVASADAKVSLVVEALRASPYWRKSLIIVTFDEYGGFWDPVAPPAIDRWGPGSRIPAVFISPLVKRGFVDHTVYETTSILAYLEKRFGLEPLSTRDAKANPLSGIFAR